MTAVWPAAYGSVELAEVDSTNEEAKRRALAGEPGPLWVRADRQIQGRGRRGNVWRSLDGNLMASLLIRPGVPPGRAVQLGYAAALAASDMLAHFAPNADFRLKWPNDILADGAKIVGILLEAEPNGGDSPWLIVGIGVNLKAHPADTPYSTASLKALSAAVPEAREALRVLAGGFARWYEVWRAQGFAPLRTAWLSRAAGLGMRVRVRLAEGETAGRFEEIDETGAMLLRLADGALRRVSAGDVHLG